jgi:hypothetical protein
MELETIEGDSCVRGHHVYNRIWTSTLGEELQCVTEDSNDNDPYTVALMKWNDIFGHVCNDGHFYLSGNGSASLLKYFNSANVNYEYG